jgi:hypothetical protein
LLIAAFCQILSTNYQEPLLQLIFSLWVRQKAGLELLGKMARTQRAGIQIGRVAQPPSAVRAPEEPSAVCFVAAVGFALIFVVQTPSAIFKWRFSLIQNETK